MTYDEDVCTGITGVVLVARTDFPRTVVLFLVAAFSSRRANASRTTLGEQDFATGAKTVGTGFGAIAGMALVEYAVAAGAIAGGGRGELDAANIFRKRSFSAQVIA